jgi:phosphoribosylanthranilate isomerase
MSLKVKICGITTLEDARHAAQAGADMIGLNFYSKSKRYINPSAAAPLVETLRRELGASAPLVIGVFVNAVIGDISLAIQKLGLNGVQLSGDESDAMLRELRGMAFKAIRPTALRHADDDLAYFSPVFPTNERLPSMLFDAAVSGEYGGTGQQADGGLAVYVRERVPRLMLAGGLTPENVAESVRAIQPWGVDVASGVEGETPGIKDPLKVSDFIHTAKAAAQHP